MEVDFDKQIDAILRDLVKGEAFAEIEPKTHLDADEISAFAENVLPANARMRAIEHLADCSRCRNILSTFASLDSDIESETIHEEVKKIAVIPSIPWYKQLFAFPQLAYTMGAFVLLFSGVIALFIFQGSQTGESSLAQADKVIEHTKGTGGASSEGQEQIREVPTVSNANVAANSSVTDATTYASPAPYAANTATISQTPLVREKSETAKDSEKEIEAKKEVASESEVANAPVPAATPTSNDAPENNVSRQRIEELPAQNRVMSPDTQSQYRRDMPMPAPRVGQSAPVQSAPRSEEMRDDAGREADKNKNVAKKAPVVTKTVGGKTFENTNNIWTDSAYKGGKTTNIKRGSADYKKLDAGLQNIGNSFKETVIIVWKGNNYRIQ